MATKIQIVAVWGRVEAQTMMGSYNKQIGWMRARDKEGSCWVYSDNHGFAEGTEKHPRISNLTSAILKRGWIDSSKWTLEEHYSNCPVVNASESYEYADAN